MTKGLEALKSLGDHHCCLMQLYESERCHISCDKCKHLQEEKIIEKELKALKIIKTNRNLCKFIIFELEEKHNTEEIELLKEVLIDEH